jgi:hypothetical protein
VKLPVVFQPADGCLPSLTLAADDNCHAAAWCAVASNPGLTPLACSWLIRWMPLTLQVMEAALQHEITAQAKAHAELSILRSRLDEAVGTLQERCKGACAGMCRRAYTKVWRVGNAVLARTRHSGPKAECAGQCGPPVYTVSSYAVLGSRNAATSASQTAHCFSLERTIKASERVPHWWCMACARRRVPRVRPAGSAECGARPHHRRHRAAGHRPQRSRGRGARGAAGTRAGSGAHKGTGGAGAGTGTRRRHASGPVVDTWQSGALVSAGRGLRQRRRRRCRRR